MKGSRMPNPVRTAFIAFAIARASRDVVRSDGRRMTHRPAKVLAASARARSLAEADRRAMTEPRLRDQIVTAAPEDFRQGVRGTVHDAQVCAQSWGFDVATIKSPVRIWHGDQDTNVPVEVGRYLAERIPGSSLTIYPGEGHLIVPKHWGEILADLLSVDPRATRLDSRR